MLLTILLGGPSLMAAPAHAVRIEPVCENVLVLSAARRQDRSGIRPLGKEPSARHILAVVRTVDGCTRPVVVNAEVGER